MIEITYWVHHESCCFGFEIGDKGEEMSPEADLIDRKFYEELKAGGGYEHCAGYYLPEAARAAAWEEFTHAKAELEAIGSLFQNPGANVQDCFEFYKGQHDRILKRMDAMLATVTSKARQEPPL